MTALGAALYGGFFGLAALWLVLTGDDAVDTDDQRAGHDRSNSINCAAASDRSSPMLLTHASQK